MSAITIYHNPSCGTSRNSMAMIRGPFTKEDGEVVNGPGERRPG